MNRRWQRFLALCLTALVVVIQLQPALAGFGEQNKSLVSANEKPAIDLTGTWAYERIGSQCTVDKCTLATFSLQELTVNGQTGKVTGEITITQRGNQFSIPDRKYVWKGGKYTLKYDGGKISGNTVTLTETAVDTSVGWGYTNSYTGTLSADGNTVEGEVIYKPSTGNNTTKTTFIWRKKVSLSISPCQDTTIKAKDDGKAIIPKSKDDAKAIVRKFREKFVYDAQNCKPKSPWIWKDNSKNPDYTDVEAEAKAKEIAKAIADRLDKLIDNPSYIYQGPLNVCGPAAFFYLWFKNDPKAAILYATKLYEKGESKIGNIDVYPGEKLVKSGNYDKVKNQMPAADWMMLSALRNSENNAIYFSGTPEDAASAFTTPFEIIKWLNATKLYKDVLPYTLPKKVSEYPNAYKKDGEVDWNKLIQDFSNLNDKDVILLIDGTKLPGKPPNTFPFPNHYIVLTSPISLGQNKKEVKLSYWTWGKEYDAKTFEKFFIETTSPIIARK